MKTLFVRFVRWLMEKLEDAYRDEKPFLNDEERQEWHDDRRKVEAACRKLEAACRKVEDGKLPCSDCANGPSFAGCMGCHPPTYPNHSRKTDGTTCAGCRWSDRPDYDDEDICYLRDDSIGLSCHNHEHWEPARSDKEATS